MNLPNRLEQFRTDNPYDVKTQAKRLLASKNEALIFYVLELGLTLAKQRQRHDERQYIKNTGYAQPTEKLVMSRGRVTGSIVIKPSKRARNAMEKLILDTWMVNGEQRLGDANSSSLAMAIQRENTSADGHHKNAEFYNAIRHKLSGENETVREKWNDHALRPVIETIYGEFRKSEAA